MFRIRSIVTSVTHAGYCFEVEAKYDFYVLQLRSITGGEIMKAMRYHSYGNSDVLTYEDADQPGAGAGQVVVRVAGTAFNPLDVAVRAGFIREVFPVALPHIPNFDVAGVITEVGDGVSGWSAGDAACSASSPASRPSSRCRPGSGWPGTTWPPRPRRWRPCPACCRWRRPAGCRAVAGLAGPSACGQRRAPATRGG
jgi:hypothetical protein